MSWEHRRQSSGYRQSEVNDRNLPPIREMFANELSLPLQQNAPLYESPYPPETLSQQNDVHKRESYVSPPPKQVTRRSKQSRRSPSQVSNASSSEKSQGGSHQMEYLGHSYSVLRSSGTSGVLVDATPPSERPQGILRQTAVGTTEQEEDLHKRYKCDYCGKRFGMPSHLEIHSRTHTAKRPYACEWPNCDRTFTVRSNLLRHVRVHCSREQPKSESDDDLYSTHRGSSSSSYRSSSKYTQQHSSSSQHNFE